MTIHSKMQFKIEQLEEEIGKLSAYIEDGRSIIKHYLEDEIIDDTDLAEWAESGPRVSVARVKRNVIVELADYMEKHGNTYRGEVIRQWAKSKLGVEQ